MSGSGVCAICGEPPSGQRISVDHDHSCCPGNRTCGCCIRELLCGKCNTLIGMADEDERRLEQAIAYLRRWSTSL
ncbi:endonuclease domain-containing protein [Gordonia cholesterolivorans]|uniref:endonuclease domain-containing protein n=1 Tax=Gordonia cholesterolivorans TaxID=559625 RepID=UPI003D15C2AA